MIRGTHLVLRPVRDSDLTCLSEWGADRNALWGPFQRFQLDHVPSLREGYARTGLLSRQSAFLMIETLHTHDVVGFVRYTLMSVPDEDIQWPEIGFGIAQPDARGKGYAREAVELLVGYLMAGYPAERIGAFTDVDNLAAQHVLEAVGFEREGVLRRCSFRDGRWVDIAIYGLLTDRRRTTSG